MVFAIKSSCFLYFVPSSNSMALSFRLMLLGLCWDSPFLNYSNLQCVCVYVYMYIYIYICIYIYKVVESRN